MTQREAFEKSYINSQLQGMNNLQIKEMLFIGSNGEYSSIHVNGAWIGWQAALSQPQQKPYAWCFEELQKDGKYTTQLSFTEPAKHRIEYGQIKDVYPLYLNLKD